MSILIFHLPEQVKAGHDRWKQPASFQKWQLRTTNGMKREIKLPNGVRVPATPGRYHLVPPPDLNQVEESWFLLEYDFPFLIVRDVAFPASMGAELLDATGQAGNWRVQNPHVRGLIASSKLGFQCEGCRRQLIPSVSYTNQQTWSSLSDQESDRGYIPCAPTAVIEIVSAIETFAALQDKVNKFVDAGTSEGVVVDTRGSRVWVYKRNAQPYETRLEPVVFSAWPGFTLDCAAIRDARNGIGL